jgi:drug/metabolite transporter (DMT)-like permease
MILHKHSRRYLSVSLIILGAIFIFLATDDAWIGVVFALAGFFLELVGIILAHKKSRQEP